MTTNEQIEIVFNLLKKHLREKKISYRELAARTQMSEANIKRIFSVKSCDLQRLMELCEASELNFFDFMTTAAHSQVSSYTLSAEAEEFFCRTFECFIFFRDISTSDHVENAIRKSKLPKDEQARFLKKLVELGLLLKTSTSYQLAHSGYLEISASSRLRTVTASSTSASWRS